MPERDEDRERDVQGSDAWHMENLLRAALRCEDMAELDYLKPKIVYHLDGEVRAHYTKPAGEDEAARVLTDDVLRAIVSAVDYDMGKSLDPDTAEEPDEVAPVLDDMRRAAIAALRRTT